MREYTQIEKDEIIGWIRRHLLAQCQCCHWWSIACADLRGAYESIENGCECDCHQLPTVKT